MFTLQKIDHWRQISAHGEKLTQVTIVEEILRSLTSKFNCVVCFIEESNDVTILSIDKLHSLVVLELAVTKKRSNS